VIRRLLGRWWAVVSIGLWALAGVIVGVVAAGSEAVPWWAMAVLFQPLLVVGVAIGLRRPEVRIGQLFALASGGFALAGLQAAELEDGLKEVLPAGLAEPVTALAIRIGVLAVACLLAALLLFPDGRLLSPWWRPLLWAIAALGAVAIAPGGGWFQSDSPAQDRILAAAFGLMLGVLAALATRAIRGTPIVRRQVGWLAYGVGAYAFFLMLFLFVFPTPNALAGVVLDAIFFLPLPVAIWIAVTRHRLYDLDRLVSRTVVYALVVALLAGVYVLSVGGITRLVPVESDLAVAASTLVVAGLFTPIQRRVQAWVDRRFFRSRYRAQAEVDGFAARLQREPDPHTIEAELISVLDRTLSPAVAGVWVRSRLSVTEP
jgi:hypothetical protein